jgi:hypothetical protein
MKKATTEYFINTPMELITVTVQEDYIPKEGKSMQLKFNQEVWRTKEETIKLLNTIIDQLNNFDL